jgi:hypothetical protein
MDTMSPPDSTSPADPSRTRMGRARAAEHGRGARAVHGGSREATPQVLDGRIRLTAGPRTSEAAARGAGPVCSWQEDGE